MATLSLIQNDATSTEFHFGFDNSYARLPAGFFARVLPARPAAPNMVRLNAALAAEIGLDSAELATDEGAALLSGGRIPQGADPIALAYAGHQFGHFVPQLGDGRAILLGEVFDREGRRRDIQLKGSGRTPFSRGGDGLAALGPVLREYLVSEAMAALGIPTTRSLAAVTTGGQVVRERFLPGAVLTRVAASHIRVGTFQFHAARGDLDAVRTLCDHAIARHYPEAAEDQVPARAFLAAVVAAQARLVARWMLVGFVHGVMNTDNMSIAGETIDYGPCAFLDTYDSGAVFSSIDEFGRYAYANQPGIAQWNLTRLAECLLPLFDEEQEAPVSMAKEILAGFAAQYEAAFVEGLRSKLGLQESHEGDRALGADLLERMAANRADFTATFRRLILAADGEDRPAAALFDDPAAFTDWAARWRERLGREATSSEARRHMMRLANPALIARNAHVEAAIEAAVESSDFAPFHRLCDALARPFDEPGLETAVYAEPPAPGGPAYRTFCGT
ncbi:protein adenylyltransferase SelO [Aureimonas mangrovi]|uniref:protein adenylyltransferase SelO n=1 Tax=Aureimonas mangrovi TaxID=2758041 RepID=UPI00163D7653|nr:YdiU family protein [Aureimonas mangrovi]